MGKSRQIMLNYIEAIKLIQKKNPSIENKSM